MGRSPDGCTVEDWHRDSGPAPYDSSAINCTFPSHQSEGRYQHRYKLQQNINHGWCYQEIYSWPVKNRTAWPFTWGHNRCAANGLSALQAAGEPFAIAVTFPPQLPEKRTQASHRHLLLSASPSGTWDALCADPSVRRRRRRLRPCPVFCTA